MSNSQGIGAATPEQGGSGVKASMARFANEALQKVVKAGKELLWGHSGQPDCPSIVKPQRVDNIMEELLSPLLEYCEKTGEFPSDDDKYDPSHNRNLGKMIVLLQEACNPFFCGPSNCPPELLKHKKVWFQADTKKLMAKCEVKSQDCCDDFVFWVEMASVAYIPAQEDEVFTGSSTQTPPEESTLWHQSDTLKLMKKIIVEGETVWVEVA